MTKTIKCLLSILIIVGVQGISWGSANSSDTQDSKFLFNKFMQKHLGSNREDFHTLLQKQISGDNANRTILIASLLKKHEELKHVPRTDWGGVDYKELCGKIFDFKILEQLKDQSAQNMHLAKVDIARERKQSNIDDKYYDLYVPTGHNANLSSQYLCRQQGGTAWDFQISSHGQVHNLPEMIAKEQNLHFDYDGFKRFQQLNPHNIAVYATDFNLPVRDTLGYHYNKYGCNPGLVNSICVDQSATITNETYVIVGDVPHHISIPQGTVDFKGPVGSIQPNQGALRLRLQKIHFHQGIGNGGTITLNTDQGPKNLPITPLRLLSFEGDPGSVSYVYNNMNVGEWFLGTGHNMVINNSCSIGMNGGNLYTNDTSFTLRDPKTMLTVNSKLHAQGDLTVEFSNNSSVTITEISPETEAIVNGHLFTNGEDIAVDNVYDFMFCPQSNDLKRGEGSATSAKDIALAEILKNTSKKMDIWSLKISHVTPKNELDIITNKVRARLLIAGSPIVKESVNTSSGDTDELQAGFWAQGFGGTEKQKAYGKTAAYTSSFYGGIVGLDGQFGENNNALLGGSLTYSQTKVKHQSTVNTKLYLAALYSNYEFDNKVFIHGLSGIGRSVSGSLKTSVYTAEGFVGYNWGLNDTITFTPKAGVKYTKFGKGQYKVVLGTPATLSTITRESCNSTVGTLEGSLSSRFSNDSVILTPSVSAGLDYDLDSNGGNVSVKIGNFGTLNTATTTKSEAKLKGKLGAGLNIQSREF